MMSHSSEPSRVRFVFFDAVGTLIYPDPPAQDVYVAVGQRFGSVLTRAQISRRFKAAFVRQEKNEILSEFERSATNEERERQRWRTIVAEVFDEVDDAQGALFEVLWVHFAQAASWKLFPDVAATWSELELRGIPSGIASNFDERLETIRQSHPPLDRCQVVCWSAEVGWPKPSPFFFRVLEQRVGAAPEELLLVGDTITNDYEGAQAAGWHALLIDRTSDLVAHDSLRSLSEMFNFLDNRWHDS